MTPTLILVFIVGSAVSVVIGALVGYSTSSSTRRIRALEKRCLEFLRESDAMRTVVFKFVTKARQVEEPTAEDYRALVDAVLHPSTPESIRQVHHKLCGTDVSVH